MAGPVSVTAPVDGFWRVARGPDPLAVRFPDPRTLLSSMSGNRFDSAGNDFGVLYFATDPRGCYGEVLARLRPKPSLIALIADEWHDLNFMELGAVSAEWRQLRTASRIVVPEDARFLDVESPTTHQFLRRELALGLSALGHTDLDVSVVRGPDRRVTRLIAEWAYNHTPTEQDPTTMYAGLRYLSRVNSDWECWALFQDVDAEVVETMPVSPDDSAFREVAALFELTIH